MMINIQKKILMMIIAVVLLTALAIIVPHIDIQSEVTQEEETTTYQVSDFFADEVNQIVIENDKGTLLLRKENDKWYSAGNEDVELNQDELNEIAYVFTHIQTSKIASTNKEDYPLYGLDEPTATVITIHENDYRQEYIIGNKAPAIGMYYMASSVSDAAFVVSNVINTYANITIDDIKKTNAIDIPIENLVKFSIDNRVVNEQYTIKKITSDNDVSLCYWEFVDGFMHDVDSRILYLGSEGYDYNLLDKLCAVSAKGVISHGDEFFKENSKEDFLLQADLFSIDGSNQTFTLYEYSEDEYALTFNDDDWVYSIPQIYITFMDVDKFMLCDPNLALISINAVDSVKVDLPDVKTSMKMTPYKKQNTDGSIVKDAYGNDVVLVDIDMDEVKNLPLDTTSAQEQMTWFYQDVVSLKIDGIVNDVNMQELKEIGSIKYDLLSEYMSEYNIVFYEYNLTHYLANKNNGNSWFLINKREITNLVNRYERLRTGSLDISY